LVADAYGSPSKRKRSRQLFNDLSPPNEHDDNDLVATLLALASPQPTAPRPRAARRAPPPDSPTSTASDPSSPTRTPSQSRRKRKPVPERLPSAGRGAAAGAAGPGYHAQPTRGRGPSRKRQRQDDDDDDSESLPPSASKRVRASPGGKKGKGRAKKGQQQEVSENGVGALLGRVGAEGGQKTMRKKKARYGESYGAGGAVGMLALAGDAAGRRRVRPLAASPQEWLANALQSPKLRRWCMYEWFYSAIDRPWFARNEFMEYLEHLGMREVRRRPMTLC